VTEQVQEGFDPRLEWGIEGALALAGSCPVPVVVDVLRFTTAVEAAVAHGARVAPREWPGPAARAGRLAAGSPPDPGTAPEPGLSSLSPATPAGSYPSWWTASSSGSTHGHAYAAQRG
jgi:2-phosphosulfolactate phosphatase